VKITAPSLIRWAGLSAVVAGICFVVLGLLHPPNVLSSVTTTRWAIVHSLALAMSLFGLLGIMGLYARQVKEAGWLGLAGFLLLSLWLVLVLPFIFFEVFILPLLANRGADVCGGLPGDLHRGRQRDKLRSPRSAMDAIRGPASARRPGVWHRDSPRRHPVALGGRSACRRGGVGPRVCAASARARAASSGADRGRSGLAGLRALVRTARASLGPRT
jgi:hypothetical protein